MRGIIFLLLLLALNTVVVAAPNVRYLFIVDTSSNMSRVGDALPKTIFEMLSTGLYGQARAGEVYGIWTFSDTVEQAVFPLQIWTPGASNGLATRAAKFVQTQKFRHSAAMERAISDMNDALKLCDSLIVFLLSDGSRAMVGTPFDRMINTAYGQRQDELKKLKRPFVTTLVSRHGEIVDWSVTAGGEKIAVPFDPVASQVTSVDFLGATSRTIASAAVPIALTPSGELSPATLPRAVVESPTANTNAAAVTRPSSLADGAVLELGVTWLDSARKPETMGPKVAPAPASAATISSLTEKNSLRLQSGDSGFTPAIQLALPPPTTAALTLPARLLGKQFWLVIVLSLLCFIAWFTRLQFRRAATPVGPSLISRAIEREQK